MKPVENKKYLTAVTVIALFCISPVCYAMGTIDADIISEQQADLEIPLVTIEYPQDETLLTSANVSKPLTKSSSHDTKPQNAELTDFPEYKIYHSALPYIEKWQSFFKEHNYKDNDYYQKENDFEDEIRNSSDYTALNLVLNEYHKSIRYNDSQFLRERVKAWQKYFSTNEKFDDAETKLSFLIFTKYNDYSYVYLSEVIAKDLSGIENNAPNAVEFAKLIFSQPVDFDTLSDDEIMDIYSFLRKYCNEEDIKYIQQVKTLLEKKDCSLIKLIEYERKYSLDKIQQNWDILNELDYHRNSSYSDNDLTLYSYIRKEKTLTQEQKQEIIDYPYYLRQSDKEKIIKKVLDNKKIADEDKYTMIKKKFDKIVKSDKMKHKIKDALVMTGIILTAPIWIPIGIILLPIALMSLGNGVH